MGAEPRVLGKGEAGTGLRCFPRDEPHKCRSGWGRVGWGGEEGSGACCGGRGRERRKGGMYEDRKLFRLPAACQARNSFLLEPSSHQL